MALYQRRRCWCFQVALGEPGKQKFYPFRAGGPKALKAALLEKFPKEEAAVDKFLELIRVRVYYFKAVQLV